MCMKGLFRHYSTWLLLVGIIVSYVAYWNGMRIYRNIKYAMAEVNAYNYRESCCIGISGIEDTEVALAKLLQLPGNISMSGLTVYLDDKGVYQLCEILLKQDEALAYPITYYDKDGEVIIGRNLTDLCFEESGKTYIMLEGSKVCVAGVVSSKRSDVLNYKLILLPNAPHADKYIMESGSLTVEYGSNEADIYTAIQEFYKENCNDMDIYYEVSENKYVDVGSANSDEKFYMVIALFSMVNCVVISEFWILRRKNEIIVRKLWGFSDARILGLLYGQMLILTSVSVALALCIEYIMYWTGMSRERLSPEQLGISVLFVLVSSFIIVLLPVYKAAHYRISSGLEMV